MRSSSTLGIFVIVLACWVAPLEARGEVEQAAHTDVMGIRLGMTPQEVRAAMQARGPDVSISEDEERVYAVDGTVGRALVGMRIAIGRQGQEALTVHFTRLPDAPRVVDVERKSQFHRDRPEVEGTRAALLEKYGPPTTVKEARRAGQGFTATWQLESGQPACPGDELLNAKALSQKAATGSYACSSVLAGTVHGRKGVVMVLRLRLVDLDGLAANTLAWETLQKERRDAARKPTRSAPDL